MLYRIYTENKNQKTIEKIITNYFDGFTIIKGQGFWKGQKENSLIIEIEVQVDEVEKVDQIAEDIKHANNQQAVIIQKINSDSWLV